jgi:hypothetical protein
MTVKAWKCVNFSRVFGLLEVEATSLQKGILNANCTNLRAPLYRMKKQEAFLFWLFLSVK